MHRLLVKKKIKFFLKKIPTAEKLENEEREERENLAELIGYMRKLTLKNIKRETTFLNCTETKASAKFAKVLKNADEELSEWIFKNNIKSWNKLLETIVETK